MSEHQYEAMALLVIDRRTLKTTRAANANEADRIAAEDALSADQIAWSIEEYDRCDGTHFTIIPEEYEVGE